LNKAWSNSKQKHITSPNILAIIKRLTVNGATDKVIEFVGPVVDSMGMAEFNMALSGIEM